jgi:transmembrane sensor
MDNGNIDQRYQELAEKWMNGSITPAEETEFNEWYNKDQYSAVVVEKEFAKDEQTQRARILAAINLGDDKKPVKLWPRIIGVAAAVAAIVFGVWFFYSSQYLVFSSQNLSVQSANDIAPGKNIATLTLANGKTINLSDVKTGVVVGEDLKYNDGSEIASIPRNDSKVQTLTAATPRGGTYQITLSDGTKVWLNADSKLEFPSKFAKKEQRIVRLSGEGYFEVSKDKAHPFIVESRGQNVKVLGTHFNINSYTDEGSVKTTLLEGAVNVNGRILKPNEKAINTNGKITIQPADIECDIAWKNGEFVFNDEPLEDIMKKVARWYDVEVEYKDPKIGKKQFAGTITRFGNVSDLLKMLSLTEDVHFKVEGRSIVVTK